MPADNVTAPTEEIRKQAAKAEAKELIVRDKQGKTKLSPAHYAVVYAGFWALSYFLNDKGVMRSALLALYFVAIYYGVNYAINHYRNRKEK